MTLPVAILAGGLSLRLRPLTDKIPKALLEIEGKPFALHQIELLRRNGLTKIVFCLGYRGEMVQTALGDGRSFGVSLGYSYDGPALLGTGGAVRQALPQLGERFFVLYGDSYLDCDYTGVEQAFLSAGKPGLMTIFRNEGHWDRSNVLFRDGDILRYDKANPTSDMEHIDYGLGVLNATALEPYPPPQPLDLAVVYQDLLARGQLAGYEVPQRFYEIGSPQGLEDTRRYLSRRVTQGR